MSEMELIEAVKAGNVASAKELVASGADVNQQDKHGWTPLNWAAGKGNLEMVSLLLEHGADIFKVGRDQRTPSMIALASGHAEVVKLLRQAETKVEGDKPSRPERKYCLACHLKELRQFPAWTENTLEWGTVSSSSPSGNGTGGAQSLADDKIVYLHEDFTVTTSIWPEENVLFNQVSDEWKNFCTNELKFRVPDDLELIVPAGSNA